MYQTKRKQLHAIITILVSHMLVQLFNYLSPTLILASAVALCDSGTVSAIATTRFSYPLFTSFTLGAFAKVVSARNRMTQQAATAENPRGTFTRDRRHSGYSLEQNHSHLFAINYSR